MRLRATTLSRRWVAGPGGVQASFRFICFIMFDISILVYVTVQYPWLFIVFILVFLYEVESTFACYPLILTNVLYAI